METHPYKKCGIMPSGTDHGPEPFATNIMGAARKNQNFRTAFWTGSYLQMTLMEIPVCGGIGLEMHPDTDQFSGVEAGEAFVCSGACKDVLDFKCHLNTGHGVFVPAGAWHNIYNTGNCPLKLSSIYAPPHHPKGTIHCTKKDADKKY